MTTADQFAPCAQKMRAEGLPEIAIQTFAHYYRQLVEGETGFIGEEDITPVESLPDAETFADSLVAAGQKALPRTIFLKLNGGLGTGMGLQKAKSLLEVKDGLTFLDIIARQALHAAVPLVLMNSFSTQADSLAALKKYPALPGKIPLDFLQHKVPKIRQADFLPVEWPSDPALTWCPPGHGDIYTALITSGLLETLLAHGYRYAFVSNSDNLGAVLDRAILGYFAEHDIPFMMEVADRTEADKKGGHLARRRDGQLILRESAQCPPQATDIFQDISHYRYFNTNNLWLNLAALKSVLAARDNVLGLTMIRNAKTVDPRDPDSTPVYQLETAMGSAIAIFQDAQAIRVPRTRFAPVKTTNDLLAVRSDGYLLTADDRVMPHPARTHDLVVELDAEFYHLIHELEARFPGGAPSLRDCERLSVAGDIRFGAGVICRGEVRLVNESGQQVEIAAGQILEGERRF